MSISQAQATLGNRTTGWGRGWKLGIGIGFVVFGLLALGASALVGAVSILILGWLIVAGGILALVSAFRAGGVAGTLMTLILGLMLLGTGIWMIVYPVEGLVSVTMLIACYLLLAGFGRILDAAFNRTPGWIWRLLGGVVSALLGVLTFIGYPVTGFVAIGLFLGLEVLMTGIWWIAEAIWPLDSASATPAGSA
jgi:uncharacterized membrane protein HdeD (DUF308 family)